MSLNIFSKLLLISIAFLFPFVVHAEEISGFEETLTVRADGTLGVLESIRYDFGQESRHGIFRTIPTTKVNQDGKKFVLDFNDISVVDEIRKPYGYKQTLSDGILELKIGDPDTTITGEHIYDISYNIRGAFTYFSDHDELYWNVTGNDWVVSIHRAQAVVQFPDTIAKSDIRLTCYTGAKDSRQTACASSYNERTHIAMIQTTAPLPAGSGMTIVVGFPKGRIAVVEPKMYIPFWETVGGKILLLLLILFAIFWYVLLPLSLPYRWWVYGRDPKPAIGEATAWFEAPKTKSGRPLTPGETGTLVDERADTADIVATIIDLARRGYLHIVEPKKGDIHLEKTKIIPSDFTHFEQNLYKEIFNTTDSVNVKGGSLITPIQEAKNELYEAVVAEGFFLKNPQSTRNMYTILGVFALITGNFPLVLSAFIFGMHMPKKTGYGAEVAAVARSLKNFISSQDRQFKFQAEKQLLFEKMLPFAIAFGVEKLWLERFAKMNLKNPDWYSGYSSGRFNAIAFASTLNATRSSVARAATPTSSSRGFSSGSSGGSSGGGGGGGGGGSW